MRISDINLYRDGGTIEFTIERDGDSRHVRLETHFKGEPRALLINSVTIGQGDIRVQELLSDIEIWWQGLPSTTRQLVQEVMDHKGPYYNPAPEISDAITLSRVLRVRDYVQAAYAA